MNKGGGRPITSIRIDPEVFHQAKVEAVRKRQSIGEWLECAILEKVERDRLRAVLGHADSAGD